MLDDEIFQKIIETFKEELSEQHRILIDGLLRIESLNVNDESFSQLLQVLFRASHNVKGAAKSVELDQVADIAHVLEDSFSQWRDESIKPSKDQIDDCLRQVDLMLEIANQSERTQENQDDGMQETSSHHHDILKVPLSKINAANARVDEFLSFKLRLEGLLEKIESERTAVQQLESACKSSQVGPLNENQQQKIQFNDDISKRISTLLLACSNQINDIKSEVGTLYGDYSRSLQVLQEQLRDMRLVPIAMVLEPLRRTARDVARSVNKEVSIEISGGQIEIDKSVLDLLGDPLLHLLRNAIGHGLEPPDERKNQGKDPIGSIHVDVRAESGKISLTMHDDGGGIDPARIRSKALEKSLVDERTLRSMSDSDVLDIIFMSGFSTQEEVSELAGRGVGLDAVRINIEAVKGSIRVESDIGKGTTFIISLPLTLATERGLFVRVGQGNYVIPSLGSASIYEIKESDITSVNDEYVYITEGRPVPVRDLGKVLNIPDQIESAKIAKLGVLLESEKSAVIILVDEILSEHECVVKPLGYPLHSVLNISGASLNASGDLLLVLNTRELITTALDCYDCYPSFASETIEETPRPAKSLRMLVVDDSLTVRNLESSVLESVGHRVDSAVNGQQAWDLVAVNMYDVIISDLEMPVMNGLDLLRRIRQDERCKDIPVIIVTSHDDDETKRRCFESGASSFLVKSQFDTKSLLDEIEKVL